MRAAYVLALPAAALLSACERPPVETVQRGYRGLGMEQVYNPRTLVAQAAANTLPPTTPPAPADGPKASETYKNVKVLGDVSAAQFTTLMVAMTQWVAPEQGCGYCHNLQDLADDSLYTKVVARRMLEMTRHINADWKTHVAGTGVTCYTCHRGKPVPEQVWYAPPPDKRAGTFAGNRMGQNIAAPSAGLSSLPGDPFTGYLAGDHEIRVAATTALPQGTGSSIKHTEWTYGLMMHMSKSLGVNCTYCHNTRQFGAWDQSTPQRNTAWYGIRMVRDLNNAYLTPLAATFPANRKGPTGDVAKANCGTCHQGAYKPLYGDGGLLAAHPALAGPAKP